MLTGGESACSYRCNHVKVTATLTGKMAGCSQ